MLALVVAEAAAIAVLGLLVAGLLRSHAEILRRLHDLGAGIDPALDAGLHRERATPTGAATAYDIGGERLDGRAIALAVSGARHNTLLAFLSSTCSTCRPFWDAFAADVDVPGGARLVVVVEDSDSVQRLRGLADPELTVVRSSAAWEEYAVPGSPHFVYVDGPSGRVVGEGTGQDWAQVRDLMAQAAQSPPGVADGMPATLPDSRDNATRIDRELAAAGIGSGHPSLYVAVDDE